MDKQELATLRSSSNSELRRDTATIAYFDQFDFLLTEAELNRWSFRAECSLIGLTEL